MDVLDQPNLAGAVAAGIEELTPELARKRRSQLRIIFDRFVRTRVAVMGMIVLAIVILLTVFAPVITHKTATFDPANTIPTHPIAFAQASLEHLLGPDALGRDVCARLLFGAEGSLLVATSSMVVALVIGVGLGSIAGFFGGWIDNVLMRVVDAALSIPYLLLLFVLSLTFSNGSVPSIVLLIARLAWPITPRILRCEFLALKQHEFLLASRTLGAGNLRLMLRHILPNAAGPIIVNATLLVGANIITESILSFFAFGLNPPQSTLRTILAHSRTFFFLPPSHPYLP